MADTHLEARGPFAEGLARDDQVGVAAGAYAREAVVVDDRQAGVERRALGQVVDVADGELVGVDVCDVERGRRAGQRRAQRAAGIRVDVGSTQDAQPSGTFAPTE